jgi:hypothetical protein
MNRRTILKGLTAATAVPTVCLLHGQDTSKVAEGEPAAKQLLLLMDTDKNGRVSRSEFMAFMQAEFDRLDTNHDGELDVKELTQLQIRHQSGHTR